MLYPIQLGTDAQVREGILLALTPFWKDEGSQLVGGSSRKEGEGVVGGMVGGGQSVRPVVRSPIVAVRANTPTQ